MSRTVTVKLRERYTDRVLFTTRMPANTPVKNRVKLAVERAVASLIRLPNVSLCGACLVGAQLRDGWLPGADLTGADLSRADLRRAQLSRVCFMYADLRGADFTDADCRAAQLRCAELGGAKLQDARLDGADLLGHKIIAGAVRSDGYQFFLSRLHGPGWRIIAGCRNGTIADARRYWGKTYSGCEQHGRESRRIINDLVALAKLRGWKVT